MNRPEQAYIQLLSDMKLEPWSVPDTFNSLAFTSSFVGWFYEFWSQYGMTAESYEALSLSTLYLASFCRRKAKSNQLTHKGFMVVHDILKDTYKDIVTEAITKGYNVDENAMLLLATSPGMTNEEIIAIAGPTLNKEVFSISASRIRSYYKGLSEKPEKKTDASLSL